MVQFAAKGRAEEVHYEPYLVARVHDSTPSSKLARVSVPRDNPAMVAWWLERCSLTCGVDTTHPPTKDARKGGLGRTPGRTLGRTPGSNESKEIKESKEDRRRHALSAIDKEREDKYLQDAFDAAVKGSPYENCLFRVERRTSHVVIIKVDNKFCLKKDGDHNGNNVFLVVAPKQLSQGCFCKCEGKVCATTPNAFLAGEGNALSTLFFGHRTSKPETVASMVVRLSHVIARQRLS